MGKTSLADATGLQLSRLGSRVFQEAMRETQRAFVYFSLHGLTVDGVIANRVLPSTVTDAYFEEWRKSQAA